MLLALEATDRSGSLALVDEGQAVDISFERSQVTHSERLMPEVDRLLEKHSADYSDLTDIAVARGPGSFTAIRLAVTTAKTLALSLDLTVVAPTTLRMMAEYARHRDCLIITALDARRGEVYTQDFRRNDNILEAQTQPRLMEPEELREHCEDTDASVLIFKGRDLSPDWTRWPDQTEVFPERLLDPLVSGLVQLSSGPEKSSYTMEPDAVNPLYVRKSDAQRSRSEDGVAV
ncbi:MAG: tRNA (adenosine(37)-N6)-threonylcarbamoyltransferase complex dimerization subunit type 1 TsaB [bacterium]